MLSNARDMVVPDSLQTHKIFASVRLFKLFHILKMEALFRAFTFELSMIRHVDFVKPQ